MSYGIVRVQKMTTGSVKGIEIHDLREKEGVSNTNQDIDWKRSKDNYDINPDKNKNFSQAVKDRIGKLHLIKAVRKDAVVMAQVLVTSDQSFFKNLDTEKQKEFFEDSYNFLRERYGRENIISATVHVDEKTPHMHFNFVPVTEDGRLSAKSVLTRQNLIEQQTAFYEEVGKKYGLERGIEGGSKKHLEIAELKARTVAENTFKLREEEVKVGIRVNELQEQKEALASELEAMQINESNLQKKISLLEKKQRMLTEEEISKIKATQTVFGALKGVTYKEYENVVYTARQYTEMAKKYEDIENKLNEMAKENQKLKAEKKKPSIQMQLELGKWKEQCYSLEGKNDILIVEIKKQCPEILKKLEIEKGYELEL